MTHELRRGFVDVTEGQVHYRESGRGRPGLPLLMLHASPGSARMLEPLIRALGATRHVIATDTLGNGDSSPPPSPSPTIMDLGGAHMGALDGLGIDRFDLYGSHTGANIACEIAIAHPGRVRRLILDGVSLYTAEERADMLANYAPELAADAFGSQLNQVWHFVRDVYLFWPWYRRDAAHRRPSAPPDPDTLHEKVVEVLKALRTYHIPYRAAIAYDKEPRLPLVCLPTLLACAEHDMFMAYFDRVRALMPNAVPVMTPGTGTQSNLAATAVIFSRFLDGDQE